MCVKNIAPTTYYDGEMPVVTTTNLDKMNKMRGTAREMTEAQRDSNRAPTENLVAVQPRRGTFITAIEAADIVNITEVRAELEGYAAQLAGLRMDGRAREAAETLLHEVEELSRPDDQDWLMRTDERIHRFTWEASGNPYLTETLERYFTHSLRIWYLVLDRVPGLGHAVQHHEGCHPDGDGRQRRRGANPHARAHPRLSAGDSRRVQRGGCQSLQPLT